MGPARGHSRVQDPGSLRSTSVAHHISPHFLSAFLNLPPTPTLPVSTKVLLLLPLLELGWGRCRGLTWPPPAPRSSGWRLSRTWSSTGPPLSWPWTGRVVARPWPQSPPRTAPATGHSHAGPTAVREPGHSLPGRGGTSKWAQLLGRWEGRPSPYFSDLFISMTLNQIPASFRVRAGVVESQHLEVPSQFAHLVPRKKGGGLPRWSSG